MLQSTPLPVTVLQPRVWGALLIPRLVGARTGKNGSNPVFDVPLGGAEFVLGIDLLGAIPPTPCFACLGVQKPPHGDEFLGHLAVLDACGYG